MKMRIKRKREYIGEILLKEKKRKHKKKLNRLKRKNMLLE